MITRNVLGCAYRPLIEALVQMEVTYVGWGVDPRLAKAQ